MHRARHPHPRNALKPCPGPSNQTEAQLALFLIWTSASQPFRPHSRPIRQADFISCPVHSICFIFFLLLIHGLHPCPPRGNRVPPKRFTAASRFLTLSWGRNTAQVFAILKNVPCRRLLHGQSPSSSMNALPPTMPGALLLVGPGASLRTRPRCPASAAPRLLLSAVATPGYPSGQYPPWWTGSSLEQRRAHLVLVL